MVRPSNQVPNPIGTPYPNSIGQVKDNKLIPDKILNVHYSSDLSKEISLIN